MWAPPAAVEMAAGRGAVRPCPAFAYEKLTLSGRLLAPRCGELEAGP